MPLDQNGGVMNAHIQKGNEALASGDLQTAKAEFKLATHDANKITRLTAKDQLKKIKDRELSERDRPEIGWLSYLGYHVGEKGIPKKERRDILKKAFYQTISIRETQFTEEYVNWWGQAGSEERFQKLCNWLSKRISEHSGKLDAVSHWKDDLLWLLSEFKKKVFPEKSPE